MYIKEVSMLLAIYKKKPTYSQSLFVRKLSIHLNEEHPKKFKIKLKKYLVKITLFNRRIYELVNNGCTLKFLMGHCSKDYPWLSLVWLKAYK